MFMADGEGLALRYVVATLLGTNPRVAGFSPAMRGLNSSLITVYRKM
jgi:hypothetical protein